MVDFNPDVNLSGGIQRAREEAAKFAPRPGRGGIVVYWFVEDVEKIGAVIEEAGGKMLSETEKEGEHGLYRYFEDPAGNLGGVYQMKF